MWTAEPPVIAQTSQPTRQLWLMPEIQADHGVLQRCLPEGKLTYTGQLGGGRIERLNHVRDSGGKRSV